MINDFEKDISKFILEYLESIPHFDNMDPNDKAVVYKVYHSIIDALYMVLVYPNVYPLILVHDIDSQQVIEVCLDKLANSIPSLERVKVRVTH
jgi:hypothetical protein